MSMPTHPLLALFARNIPAGDALDWDDLVVGHDFGLVPAEAAQAWVRDRGRGEAARALAALEGAALAGFEAALWRAAAEATGKTPRPGSTRWARSQDRWRLALLRDALAAPLGPEALAVALDAIHTQVGCPEDMQGLWRLPQPWEGGAAWADRDAVRRFIAVREPSAYGVRA